MRIVLFEALLEEHVRDSLERSLRKFGHDVIAPPAGWRGSTFPATRQQKEWSATAADGIIDAKPDLMVCFRPSALPAGEVQRIRDAGVITAVWLSDDPVLYNSTYRHIVDNYDIVLNCGDEHILDFYHQKHGITGVNFPFWTDDIACPNAAYGKQYDIVFLGNCFGDVRRRRYNIISALPGSNRIYGQVDNDPLGISVGSVSDHMLLMRGIGAARIGFNIPQIFSDYKNNPLNFPELARLGSFPIPSRVVQYSSLGIPILTFGRERAPTSFPEMLCGRSVSDCAEIARDLLSSPERLDFHGRAAHQRFVASYSADRRAAFLEWLVKHNGHWQSMPTKARVDLYDAFDRPGIRDASDSSSVGSAPYDLQLPPMDFSEGIQPKAIIALGSSLDATDPVACHIRALRRLGHSVLHLDPRNHDDLYAESAGQEGRLGRRLLDAAAVQAHANVHEATIVITIGGDLAFSPQGYSRLKQVGICVIGVTLTELEDQRFSLQPPLNLDLHFASSQAVLDHCREPGREAHLMPLAVDSAWVETDVLPEPDWTADVIATGSGNPERNAVMRQVASRFGNVKIYGSDWEVEGSAAISGLNKIKAYRGGLLHINFPETVRGRPVLSQGPFETIASGGILMTEATEDICSLFEPGKDFVSYRDADELCDQIEYLLANPKTRNEMRRVARTKLATSNLYEHRWIDAWTHVAKRSSPQASTINRLAVVIAGYDHDVSDQRIVIDRIVSRLRSVRPGAEVSLLTRGSSPLGVRRILVQDEDAVYIASAAADVVIAPPEGLDRSEIKLMSELLSQTAAQEGAALIEWTDQDLDELAFLEAKAPVSRHLFGLAAKLSISSSEPDGDSLPDSDYVAVGSELALGEADVQLTTEARWLLIQCEPGSQISLSFMLDRSPSEEATSALVQVQHVDETDPVNRDKTPYGHWHSQLGRCKFLPRPNQRGISKLEFTAPSNGELKLGFRLWKNSSDILMSQRVCVRTTRQPDR